MLVLKIKNHIKFIVFFCAIQSLYSQQVSTVTNLPNLLNIPATDSVQKIERLAAFKFHHLINNYRLSKKLDTLAWNDTLWLISRNHSIWMSTNLKLSHGEIKGTPCYTGNSPGQRFTYAQYNNPVIAWSGENALYNFSSKGRTINEIAENVANQSIVDWKNSPGHNSNMLDKKHQMHGVSFCLNTNGKVYATDLFAIYDEQSLNYLMYAHSNNNNNNSKIGKKTVSPKDLTLQKELMAELYELSEEQEKEAKRSKAAEKASIRHSDYMANLQKVTHEEVNTNNYYYAKNVNKRIQKAATYTYFLLHPNLKVAESIAVIEVIASNLKLDKIAKEILLRLNTEGNMINNPLSIGYGVSIIRFKGELKIYVTRIIGYS